MSNERYLIVSYFVLAAVCLGLGVLVHLVLRKPFAAIADSVLAGRSPILKRALALSLTAAAFLGFLGYSYNEKGCISYEQVIQNRASLVQANAKQVQGTADWIIWTVLAWGVVVAVVLAATRKQKSGN